MHTFQCELSVFGKGESVMSEEVSQSQTTQGPTYLVQRRGAAVLCTCLVPMRGREQGYCGHMTVDEGFMTMHMSQIHDGIMIAEEMPLPADVSDPATPPTAATSPRTAGQQEHPPQVPIPTPHPHEPIPPAEGEPA